MIATRNIGTTDIAVTELGFGGAPLGVVGDLITDEEAVAIMRRAWDGGIRYFDTAPLYGHGLSEKRVGRALRELPRDAFVLSTKIGRLLVAREEGERVARARDREPFAIRYDYSFDAVRRSIESSLDRLGLDRIDILLCHDIDAWTHGDAQPGIFDAARNGALPALRELRAQGVVRAIGLGVNEWQVCSRVLDMMDVDCFLLAGRSHCLNRTHWTRSCRNAFRGMSPSSSAGPYNSGILTTDDRLRATYDYKPGAGPTCGRKPRRFGACANPMAWIRARLRCGTRYATPPWRP